MLTWTERTHGLRSACLRYFNAAGAHPNGRLGEDHDPETHLIPIVLDVALGKRKHIDVFGNDYPTPDGACVRDYIHVCDLAEAHILALGALETRSLRYNLGNGKGYSVLEVIEMARRVTGHPIPMQIAARRPGDPAVLVAASERIRAELGWAPRFADLESIVASAWAWKKAHPRGYEDRR
jgi:UDP-glucose 4-epimerase